MTKQPWGCAFANHDDNITIFSFNFPTFSISLFSFLKSPLNACRLVSTRVRELTTRLDDH